MNLDNDGTGDESTLVKRRLNDSEFLDLDAKFGKSGIGEWWCQNRRVLGRGSRTVRLGGW